MKTWGKGLISLGVLLGFFIFLGACGNKDQDQKKAKAAVPVQATKVVRQDLDYLISTFGTIMPNKKVLVIIKVPGKIKRITKNEGDRVTIGEALVYLEDDDYQNGVKQARAAMETAFAGQKQAKVNLEMNESQYQRMKNLRENDVITQDQFEKVEAGYKAAKASLELATAQVNQARAGLNYASDQLASSVLTSPLNGFVTQRFKDEGDRMHNFPPEPILLLMEINPVKMTVELPEKELSRIKIGMPVEARVDSFPDKKFLGKITMINQMVDFVSRTVKVEVELPNSEGLLKPGMFARMVIKAGSNNALILPRDTLVHFPGTGVYYVYTIVGGKAQLTQVTLGKDHDGLTEIQAGVKEGDLVVLIGQANLATGVPVTIVAGENKK